MPPLWALMSRIGGKQGMQQRRTGTRIADDEDRSLDLLLRSI
jgi:hypothetical protein